MGNGAGRRYRSKEERRQIVEETLVPGASVSRVARTHEINANQVFQWRKLYRAGQLEAARAEVGALLPVRVKEGSAEPKTPRTFKPGLIDIDLGHARLRIEGAADPACVRAALEGLRR